MDSHYELTCISEVSLPHHPLASLEEASDLCGLHPEMIEEFLRASLVQAFEGNGGELLFDQSGIARLRHIAHLRDHEHTSLRTLRYIVSLLDNLNALEREVRQLRERLR
jgi:DNA-binding transcriptional MerR regulator